MVTQHRELKSKIANVGSDMGDAIDEHRTALEIRLGVEFGDCPVVQMQKTFFC